jgi:hypothetical protein
VAGELDLPHRILALLDRRLAVLADLVVPARVPVDEPDHEQRQARQGEPDVDPVLLPDGHREAGYAAATA